MWQEARKPTEVSKEVGQRGNSKEVRGIVWQRYKGYSEERENAGAKEGVRITGENSKPEVWEWRNFQMGR